MADLESGISALLSALEKSSLSVGIDSASEHDIKKLQDVLPVTDVLCEWYRRAAPLDFEIPWTVEWLKLFAPRELIDNQVGYRWTGDIGGDQDEEWSPNWVAIGECSADPIIADTGSPATPILMAMHGTGSWEPLMIAPNLPDYLLLLSSWVNTLETFGKCIRSGDGELRIDFLESFRERLSGIIPASCVENLVSFF